MAAVLVDDDEEELSPDEENMISASEDEVRHTHTHGPTASFSILSLRIR